EFRRLGIELACLAASQFPAPDVTTDDLAAFAAEVLDGRLKKLAHIEGDLATLEPEALHAIRLRAKRLRYAAEIFAALAPGKGAQRFLRRLSRLQDRFGSLNDGAVAAHLLGELGSGHAFATGLVLGFVGAHGSRTRERIGKAWHAFHRADPFWR